jgi:hypothetical protein
MNPLKLAHTSRRSFGALGHSFLKESFHLLWKHGTHGVVLPMKEFTSISPYNIFQGTYLEP